MKSKSPDLLTPDRIAASAAIINAERRRSTTDKYNYQQSQLLSPDSSASSRRTSGGGSNISSTGGGGGGRGGGGSPAYNLTTSKQGGADEGAADGSPPGVIRRSSLQVPSSSSSVRGGGTRQGQQQQQRSPSPRNSSNSGSRRGSWTVQQSDFRLQEFKQLLNGLATLHDDGLLHQVYCLAIESMTCPQDLKHLAEALHQRWLSDPSFPPVAARLCLQLADLEVDDLRFGSMIFTIVVNDFRDHLSLRKSSRAIFVNNVYFTFQFYFEFRHRGPIFKSLCESLFAYLNVLLDKDATDTELILVHRLLCYYGADLSAMNYRETQNILLKVRHKLIDGGEYKARIRGKLLEIVDLSYSQFEYSALTDDQQDFYARYHVDSLHTDPQKFFESSGAPLLTRSHSTVQTTTTAASIQRRPSSIIRSRRQTGVSQKRRESTIFT